MPPRARLKPRGTIRSSLGTFSTRSTEVLASVYRSQERRAMAGTPPCVVKQMTRPIRNREAPVPIRA
jgi:hypothetical protein